MSPPKWCWGYKAAEIVGKTTPTIFHVAEEIVTRAQILSQELHPSIKPSFEVFIAKAKLGQADKHILQELIILLFDINPVP